MQPIAGKTYKGRNTAGNQTMAANQSKADTAILVRRFFMTPVSGKGERIISWNETTATDRYIQEIVKVGDMYEV